MQPLLRYAADRRTVIFIIVTTAILFLQWNLPSLNIFLYIVCLYLAIAVSVIAHNHNHLPIWRNRFFNILTDYWITVFYGFPAFAWIPTHNANHHKFNNRAGDYTITYRYSESNNVITLVTYPSISGYFQQRPIRDYLGVLWRGQRPKFYLAVSQYLVLAIAYVVALWIDWQKALLYLVIPNQVSLFSVLIFNYVQHVHADEESRYNHSRNFIGFLNLMLFNNGYHTIHHEHPGIHWSETPKAQESITAQIDPALIERSFWWYIFRVYILGLFSSRFRTISMRLKRLATA